MLADLPMTNKDKPGPSWTDTEWRARELEVSSDLGMISTAHYGSIPFSEALANARLQSAGPEMFRALEAFNLTKEQIISGGPDHLTVKLPLAVIRQAAAALSKARGEP